MKRIPFLLAFLLLSLLFLNSCASKSSIVYLNGPTNATNSADYEMRLQADDNLMIAVTSINPEITIPYNLQTLTLQTNSEIGVGQQKQLSYLISKEGTINFPVLGVIHLGGLTRLEAQQKIENLLKDHIADANVIIRVLNFKVTVLGEVTRPGPIQVATERITLLEALGRVGDLSVFGKRNNILLI